MQLKAIAGAWREVVQATSRAVAWVRAERRRSAATLAGLFLLVVLAAAVLTRGGVGQPISFNHRHHTQALGLDCTFCHEYALTGAHSGLPSRDICATCHQTVLGESREAARVTEIVEQGRPLVFAKLFRLPANVFYTHRRHTALGGVECASCHGGIAMTTSPPRRPLVRVDMDFCMDCHRRTGQSLDCVACHR